MPGGSALRHAAARSRSIRAPGRLALAFGLATVWHSTLALPPVGTADLVIRIQGPRVEARLSAAAQTLVGFTGAPADAVQRDELKTAAENLRHGDALIRFNPQASCVLERARVDADPRERRGGAVMGADYRFHCDFPQALGSAAVALFMGFTALERVHVHYSGDAGAGAAVVTRTNPVFTLVPLTPRTGH